MYIIGENIHIIADSVKKAVKERDAKFFQELAVKQVEAGADAIDLILAVANMIGKRSSRGWSKRLRLW